MSHKSFLSIILCFLLGAVLFFFMGCDVSDVNNQSSVTSGTTTGSGSSGGTPANVTVTAGSNTLATNATTTITVIVTDAAGRRTDASIILTSSMGGTFNETSTSNGGTSLKSTTLNGNTSGGILIAEYKAPGIATEDEITATVTGTAVRGTTIITVITVSTTSL
jgi:hypothetical protein